MATLCGATSCTDMALFARMKAYLWQDVLVLKHGPGGADFVIDGVADHRAAVTSSVVDVTGAGDSLTAGFLVGGADLAMETAARCVEHVGAQPPEGAR